MNVCGAKTRAGTPCKRPAMDNGRCRLHGGLSTGRPPITGRYSVTHRASLAEKVQRFKADPTPGDLSDELAMLRALTDDYLGRFVDGVPMRAEDVERLAGLLVEISKMVERIAKILNSTALTAAEIAYLQARLADLIRRYVPVESQDAFLSELSASIEARGRLAG